MLKSYESVKQRYPKLAERFKEAGYKVQIVPDAQLYARRGQVMHAGTVLWKNIRIDLPIKDHATEHWTYLTIRVVFVDLKDALSKNTETLGVNFFTEIGFGTPSYVMLDRGEIGDTFSIADVEQAFLKCAKALLID